MKKHFLSVLIAMAVSTSAFAQQEKTITGTVYDRNTGEPLIGVTIMECGTHNGTVTDLDGKYRLKVKSNQINVSYVGYTSTTMKTLKDGNYDIRLDTDNALNEIVVVGYGTQRKSDLTGALSSISEKDIKNYATSNVSCSSS